MPPVYSHDNSLVLEDFLFGFTRRCRKNKKRVEARLVYQNPELFDRIKRAWAIWMLANSSFGSLLDGSFSYPRSTGGITKALANKRLNFSD